MIKPIERAHLQIIVKRIKERRRFIQVLFGPRHVGKTTLIAHAIKATGVPYHSAAADAVPAGLLGGIEKYSKDAIRKRSSSPKFQVHNTAFISAQHDETFAEIVSQPHK